MSPRTPTPRATQRPARQAPAPSIPATRRTVIIEHVEPTVDGGRYAPKRCVGDTVTVAADVFSDGHEKLRAMVRYRAPGARSWPAMSRVEAAHTPIPPRPAVSAPHRVTPPPLVTPPPSVTAPPAVPSLEATIAAIWP